MALSDSRHGRRLTRRRGRYPRHKRVSPDYPNHHSDVPCPLPRRIAWVRVSIASPRVQPSPNGRRVGIRIVTFEACIGFTLLRPTGSLSHPRQPLSRGSSPSDYPAEPLVSFQINRQLSGWNPPPQVFRAFGAHGHRRTFAAPATYQFELPTELVPGSVAPRQIGMPSWSAYIGEPSGRQLLSRSPAGLTEWAVFLFPFTSRLTAKPRQSRQ
jgi:hypothetical protein